MERVRQVYEKVFDEENDGYFYYNKISGTSRWTAPRVLLGRPLDPKVRSVRDYFSVFCKKQSIAAENVAGKAAR